MRMTKLVLLKTSLALLLACTIGYDVSDAWSQQSNVDAQQSSVAIQNSAANMTITESEYGQTAAGQAVTLYRCTNKNGTNFSMIDYGATMVSLETRDNRGELANIILTCDSIEGFEKCQSYFGCTVGRYCNRIAAGKFSLDGQEYNLATNNGENHLHGGNVGFDKKMWQVEKLEQPDSVGLRFMLTSSDGDEGYPGTLQAKVDYVLNNDDELEITYEATTDAPTVCSLTNHNYWNLTGKGESVLEHSVTLYADQYVAVDGLIPTGELATVGGTPLDFRTAKQIGSEIEALRDSAAKGYDHCFAVRSYTGGDQLRHAADVLEPTTGRVMQIFTNQPGIQFYSGNFLDGSEGSGGYPENAGFCLETQKHPDSPNQPNFPSAVLKPGETYRHQTLHKFRVAK